MCMAVDVRVCVCVCVWSMCACVSQVYVCVVRVFIREPTCSVCNKHDMQQIALEVYCDQQMCVCISLIANTCGCIHIFNSTHYRHYCAGFGKDEFFLHVMNSESWDTLFQTTDATPPAQVD